MKDGTAAGQMIARFHFDLSRATTATCRMAAAIRAVRTRFIWIRSGLLGWRRLGFPSNTHLAGSGQVLARESGQMLMQERWQSVGEIAARLGVNPDTIYKRITRKKTPTHKLGKLRKFLASEVEQWVTDGHAAEDAATGLSPKAAALPGGARHGQ